MGIIKTLFIGAFLFALGALIGGLVVSLPSVKNTFRKAPKGFSEREMMDNANLKDLSPASSDEEYSRVPDHL